MNLSSISGHPWQVALAVGLLSLVLYLLARIRLEQANEDWANAFFYSPSQKTRQRVRRQRWQDWCRALLACTLLGLGAAAVFYLRGPR